MMQAVRWGLVIGVVNALWLYVTFWMGFHTNGIVRFQVVPFGWLLITIACYVAALRSLGGAERPAFAPLFKAGVTIAVVTAVVAVAMQVGYYTVVHPEWPQVMAAQTREHFAARGAPPLEIERQVEIAAETFSLPTYAMQSALAAIVLGVLLAAAIPASLRWNRKRQSGAIST